MLSKYSVVLLVFVFCSCKKKEVVSDPIQGGGTPDKVTAFLQTTIQTELFDDIASFTTGFTYAVFFDSLRSNVYNNNTYLNVGAVSINSVQLTPWPIAIAPPPFYAYGDTLNTLWGNILSNPPGNKKHWIIDGSSVFPHCDFWDYTMNPTYSNYEILPDTIHLSKPTALDIAGYENCTSVRISINGQSTFGPVKDVLPPMDKINFSVSELSQLGPPTDPPYEIKINFVHDTYIARNGMIFLCQSNLIIKKRIEVQL